MSKASSNKVGPSDVFASQADFLARSDRQLVEWLLEFLRVDLDDLRVGALVDLWDDARLFREPRPTTGMATGRLAGGPDHRHKFPVGSREEVAQSLRDLLTPCQERLRAGVEALRTKGRWVATADPERRPKVFREVHADGTVQRRFSGHYQDVFVEYAADLIGRWWPQLRRCKYESCGVWFLPRHGRQQYHDPKCSAQRFAAEHKRDYHAEYVQRVKREVGKGAKPQRRPRRRKTKGDKK